MTHAIDLTLIEARVLGALLEKEVTTPEHYPLSLNALLLACNQKSNREPVMTLSEANVRQALDALEKKHLVVQRSGFGSRVEKFQQRFCNTEFSEYRFSPQERALLSLLLLRGPQTSGELRARSNRLCEFKDMQEVDTALGNLLHHQRGAFITRLPREAGRRESRYAHLLSGEVEGIFTGETDSDDNARIVKLEEQVQQLLDELAELKSKLDM